MDQGKSVAVLRLRQTLALRHHHGEGEAGPRDIGHAKDPKASHLEQAGEGRGRVAELAVEHHLVIGHQVESVIEQAEQQVGFAGPRRADQQHTVALMGGTACMELHLVRNLIGIAAEGKRLVAPGCAWHSRQMLDRSEIAAAAGRLSPHVRRTPSLVLGQVPELGVGLVTVKLEVLQHSGSFKARGAFNRLLTAGDPARPVVAASGGNHGAAVAYAARSLGRQATIFVPGLSPPTKVARIRSYGATVMQDGANYAEAYALSQRWAEARGALQVHAYDDPAVLAGQGTIGLEMAADSPALTHVLVAVGGGGLIGGIASWFAGTHTRVVGVEPASCPSLAEALAAGRPVPVAVGGVAADSLGARQVGALMFDVAMRTGLASVLVSDADITAAQTWLWEHLRVIAEPGGATALAALLSGAWAAPAGSQVGVVLCGGNTDPGSVS